MRSPRSQLERIVYAPLFWMAVLYLLVGVVYARITPDLEKPDENGHYGYIVYLREHRALPPLLAFAERGRADFERADQLSTRMKLAFEFKQPPLYYVTAAVLSSWLPDDPDPDEVLAQNPFVWFSVPGHRNDNRNRFLHPPDMTSLILAARLVSLLFGLGTVLTTYFLAAQLFPKNSLVPIVTAAVLGFQPNFLYIATSTNNDMATTFLGTLAVTFVIYRLKKGEMAHFAVWMGAILGLASITKVSALVFIPLTGLALLLIHRGLRRAFFRDGVIIVAVALLIGGWWYVRNALVYGDPLTLGAHNAAFEEERPLLGRLEYDLTSIERTYWANPSHVFIGLIALDKALIWWGRITLVLLVLSPLLNYSAVRSNLAALVVLLSWPVTFMFLLIFYWNQRASWPFGRLLYPAIVPLTFLLVLAWQYALPVFWRRPVLTFLGAAMMVIGILIPFVSLYPLFHPWREWQAQQVEHPVGTVYIEPETGRPIARLIGYNSPDLYALAGKYLAMELCWEPLGRTDVPYTLFVQLLDLRQLNVGEVPGTWGRRETYPGLGNLPTDRWPLRRAFCDRVLVRAFRETPTPLGTAIEVGFTDSEHKIRLRPVDAENDPIDLATVGRVPILAPQDLPTARQPTHYILDSAIGLDRVQLSDSISESITLTLTWQSLQRVPYDATMFVHLKGADGSILAQTDRQPLDGRFPTSYWLPGQIITDVLTLPRPEGGPLALNIGLYTWPSLQRLPAVDTSGAPQRDNVIVIDLPSPSR